MTKKFDFVNLLTYDLHDQRESVTAHHALSQPVTDETTNANWAITSWTDLGANPTRTEL